MNARAESSQVSLRLVPMVILKSKYSTILTRIGPRQGWDSFILLTAAVGTTAWSVREADWVETPGLFLIVLFATSTGLLLSQSRLPWPLQHVTGIMLGIVITLWQSLNLIEGDTFISRLTELFSRLDLWYDAAVTGGISTDLFPFTIILFSLAWLLGYSSSWSLFARGNLWMGLILCGLALFTNLSFLPDDYENKFFMFMLPAMLLVAKVGMIRQRDKWEDSGITFSTSASWTTLGGIALLSVIILAISAAMPMKVYVSKQAVNIWKMGRAPVEQMEEEFARLFSGIASRKGVSGRFFGKTLPFQGSISFGGENVIFANSEIPTYLISRTYSKYTPQGWMAAETEKQLVPTDSFPPPSDSFMRSLNRQSLQLTFNSSKAFHSGNVTWISRDAVVEILKPMHFEMELKTASGNTGLPEDVRNLANQIRRYGPSFTKYDLSRISMMLPEDLVLLSPHLNDPKADGSPLARITVARKTAILPDVISWTFDGLVETDDTYAMQSYVSTATNEDLRKTGTNYGNFITDHYLQLPPDFPPRIRNLAKNLTEDAGNQLDKALAVQEYLRGPTFKYSREIDKPPSGTDGTDYFLFDSKTGYSDYFASAMSVILRSVGVPTRLAAGYAPGVSEGGLTRRSIRDSDSHTWTQVYFQGHGWVDFEPTSNWADPRYEGATSDLTQGSSSSYGDSNCFELLDLTGGDMSVGIICDSDDGEQESTTRQLQPEPQPIQTFDLDSVEEDPTGDRNLYGSLTNVAIAIVIVIVLIAIIWLFWTRSVANIPIPERLYAKMNRLGSFAGLARRPNETPFEYAVALGNTIPSISTAVRAISISFSNHRYSKGYLIKPTKGTPLIKDDHVADLHHAWKIIRRGLLAHLVKKLVGIGTT